MTVEEIALTFNAEIIAVVPTIPFTSFTSLPVESKHGEQSEGVTGQETGGGAERFTGSIAPDPRTSSRVKFVEKRNGRV
jgi:hypothetical protein